MTNLAPNNPIRIFDAQVAGIRNHSAQLEVHADLVKEAKELND